MAVGAVAQNLTTQTHSGGISKYQDVERVSGDMGASGSASNHENRKKATRYDIELEAKDVSDTKHSIEKMVEQNKGIVTSSNIRQKSPVSATVDFRVPESNSSKVLTRVEELGKLESKRKTVDDLTDQYDEVTTELDNRKQELQQLERLMNNTEKVSELVEIQERMSTVRSRIDYLEQRKTRLDNRVEYTDFSVTISQPTPFNTDFEPRETFADAYKGFFNSIKLLIVGLAYITPIAIILSTIYGLKRLYVRYREE
jgi:DNA repair ATPase RecN